MLEFLALLMQECLFFLGYITGKSQFPKPLTRQEEAEAIARMQTGDEEARKALEERFRAAMNDNEVQVQLKPFKAEDTIAMITVDEQNRRFTEMSARWGGPEMKLPEKRTLVLNSRHPLVKWLEQAPDDETSKDVCAQVADLAEMARQPLVAERMVDFLKRSNQLLTRIIDK